MSNHERKNPDQAGQVIESIAQREQELQGLLNGAQAEAEKILNEARTQAGQLLKSAQQDLLQQAGEQKRTRDEKEQEIREQLLAKAGKEVAALEQKALANRQKAVEAIVQQVLPEEQ
ncbi:MAG: V-type ATPase subunit subunit G family protein [bacterium]|nr:V-type ATPase subunit subunit G family protein [bacterium]